MANIRIGIGYDVHPFETGRTLRLGGVTVPFDRGLAGDSDADVLLHAIMDALLGSLALGDLGRYFPPGDARFKGANSLDLLANVLAMVEQSGWQVANVDATLVAEAPRLGGYLDAMRRTLAAALGVGEDQVGVKATSTDGLGSIGRGEGIAAQAVVLVEKRGSSA